MPKEGREHERGAPPLFRGVRGSPPRKFGNFSASMCVLMGFYAFGTRFQSRLYDKRRYFLAHEKIEW